MHFYSYTQIILNTREQCKYCEMLVAIRQKNIVIWKAAQLFVSEID